MDQIKQSIGFTFEIFSFTFAGYLLGIQKYLFGLLFLLIACGLAVWTGNEIKKDAISEYRINSKS